MECTQLRQQSGKLLDFVFTWSMNYKLPEMLKKKKKQPKPYMHMQIRNVCSIPLYYQVSLSQSAAPCGDIITVSNNVPYKQLS